MKSSTDHPFRSKLVFKLAYRQVFLRAAATIFLSSGTVSSAQIIRLVETDHITMSGRWLVIILVSGGMVLLLLKSKVICQSVGRLVWRIDDMFLLEDLGVVPCFIKYGSGLLPWDAFVRFVLCTRPTKSLCIPLRTLSCLQVYRPCISAI